MAGRGNPSFLKNQKARKRQEKAAAKRAARQARRDAKANPESDDGSALDDAYGEEVDTEAEGAETPDGEASEVVATDESGAAAGNPEVAPESKPTP